MITCELEFHDDVEDLHKLFLSEKLESGRARCEIDLGKTLLFKITAKDIISMKAFLSSIIKTAETYEKTKALVK